MSKLKKNLTIRIDEELREQLQLIADEQMRPLANQILYFLTMAVDAHKRNNNLVYVPDAGQFMNPIEQANWENEHPPF